LAEILVRKDTSYQIPYAVDLGGEARQELVYPLTNGILILSGNLTKDDVRQTTWTAPDTVELIQTLAAPTRRQLLVLCRDHAGDGRCQVYALSLNHNGGLVIGGPISCPAPDWGACLCPESGSLIIVSKGPEVTAIDLDSLSSHTEEVEGLPKQLTDCRDATTGDIDGDGQVELILVAPYFHPHYLVVIDLSSMRPESLHHLGESAVVRTGTLATRDLDADGRDEVLLVRRQPGASKKEGLDLLCVFHLDDPMIRQETFTVPSRLEGTNVEVSYVMDGADRLYIAAAKSTVADLNIEPLMTVVAQYRWIAGRPVLEASQSFPGMNLTIEALGDYTGDGQSEIACCRWPRELWLLRP